MAVGLCGESGTQQSEGLRTVDIVPLHHLFQRTFSVLTAASLGLLSFSGLSRSSCASACPGRSSSFGSGFHWSLSVSRVGQMLCSYTLYPSSHDSSKQSIEGTREGV